MRYKKTALIFSICLIVACTACRRTPTTDYIANKEGQDSLISDHETTDTGVSIREQCNAPEHVEAEGKPGNEYTVIRINASVEIPEKSTIPVYSFTTRHYAEEELEPLAEILFPDGGVKNWNPQDSWMTEEQLYQNIEDLQKAMDNMVIEDIPEEIWDDKTGELITGTQELYDSWANSKQELEQELATLREHKADTGISYTYSELSDHYTFQTELDDATWVKIDSGELDYDDVAEKLNYTYKSIGMQGMKNGLVYDMKLDDDGSNTILYYAVDRMQTLKNGSNLYNMDSTTSYHSGYGSANKCLYSDEEAGKLVTDLLSELGYDGFQVGYICDLNTVHYRSHDSLEREGNRITNGYGLYLYRGIDGMSEVYNSLAQEDNVYYQFMNLSDLPFNSINNMLNVEEYTRFVTGSTDMGRYKEIVFANVLDDGVVQLAIINPMQEKELLAENVELIDFDQALNQGIAYLETKYGEMGTYLYHYSLDIQNIQLNYAYMRSPDNPEEYTMIPVWDFRSGPNGNIYVTVNAIDGTVFERAAMY
ncbi:MAG: hypothetical protein IJ079_04850 [Lachnospiraceae bacterium]|nr:hypothetical protein [Lachnospiraceae bacterium]